MARITFIGAGSFGFTRTLVKDLLTFDNLKDVTFVLMDINKQRLNCIKKAVEAIVAKGNYPATVIATTDRKEALKGADAVLCTVLAGATDVWQHDILIPKKYGVDTCVGDTRGPSGIFRALRTIPLMLDICRDIERYCPKAFLLNYTNPMAMLCRAMQRETSVDVSGLCHSVQGTAEMLARWINTPMEKIDYLCAGLNHMSFFLEYKKNGKDAYPLIRKALLKDKKLMESDYVRNEMFMHLGYYITESSGHNSEYNWWFRKSPALIRKYCTTRKHSNWNPGMYAYIVKYYKDRDKNWKRDVEKWLADIDNYDLSRGHEYAASIISARMGGTPFQFNGNVPNTGLLTNVSDGVCVEVPVLSDRSGFHPMYVGALPAQCAAMVNITAAVEDMAVEAAINGDPTLVCQAVSYDPLTAAVLSLPEIKKMTQEMLTKNKRYLTTFKSIKL